MLTAILLACRHNLSLHTLDSGSGSGSSEPVTSCDLLRVALRLPGPTAAPQAVLAFVELLQQQGVIGDRAAVHCLAHLRGYLQERAHSVLERDEDLAAATSGVTVPALSEELAEIARACMSCIHEETAGSHCASLFSTDPVVPGGHGSSSAALELLPFVVELLMSFAEETAMEVVDSLLRKVWPTHLLLTLCSLMCDLLPFLSVRGKHFSVFKVSSFLPLMYNQ
jgi:hypothetical protein